MGVVYPIADNKRAADFSCSFSLVRSEVFDTVGELAKMHFVLAVFGSCDVDGEIKRNTHTRKCAYFSVMVD